jgi:MFS transporter, OFA family, oxalate/formate antiporter
MPRPSVSSDTLRRTVPVLGAFVVGAIAYAPLYCYPLLAPQFEKAFGTSRELGQMPWTAFLLLSALCSPLLGRAFDEISDRLLLLVGTVLLTAGWVLISMAPGVAVLIAAYGALLAIGIQLVFVGTSTAMARRYAGVTGLALGVAYAGPGIGVALALPVAAGVIPGIGWRSTAELFAVLSLLTVPFVLLMTSGAAVLVPARTPAPAQAAGSSAAEADGSTSGLPSGAFGAPSAGHPGAPPAAHPAAPPAALAGAGLHETSAPGAIAASLEPVPPGSRSRPDALRRTVRTRRFVILLLGAVCIGCIDEGVFQTSSRHAVAQGIGADFAATMLALQCYAYVVGQVVGGGLSDRFGRRFIGLLCAGMIVVGASGIFAANGSLLALSVAGNSIYGFGIGATIAIRSATFSDVFGGHNLGAIFGITAVAYPAGGIIVMNAGGIMYDRIGNYWPVYVIAMLSVLIWSSALVVAGPRHHGLRKRLRVVRARMPV